MQVPPSSTMLDPRDNGAPQIEIIIATIVLWERKQGEWGGGEVGEQGLGFSKP